MWGYGQGVIETTPTKPAEPTKVETTTKITFRNDYASMSSYWKDDRNKAYNPFKTTEFSNRWGAGAFTCVHSLNDEAGAWWMV